MLKKNIQVRSEKGKHNPLGFCQGWKEGWMEDKRGCVSRGSDMFRGSAVKQSTGSSAWQTSVFRRRIKPNTDVKMETLHKWTMLKYKPTSISLFIIPI